MLSDVTCSLIKVLPLLFCSWYYFFCFFLLDMLMFFLFFLFFLIFFCFFFFCFCFFLFFWFFLTFFVTYVYVFVFFSFFSLGAYKLPLQPSKMMVLQWKSLHFWKITVLYWKSFLEAFWNCFGVILGAFGRLFHFFHFFSIPRKISTFFVSKKKCLNLFCDVFFLG